MVPVGYYNEGQVPYWISTQPSTTGGTTQTLGFWSNSTYPSYYRASFPEKPVIKEKTDYEKALEYLDELFPTFPPQGKKKISWVGVCLSIFRLIRSK